MKQVKVFFFANFRDVVGARQVQVELAENATVSDLRKLLLQAYPAMTELIDIALISINREFAFDEDLIPTNAEVAIFPPVSGGSNQPITICKIEDGEIDFNHLLAEISTPLTGAACFFTGMVRGITTRDNANETAFLEYDAYINMEEAKMQQIADEIRQQWSSIQGIAIVQRIGRLDPQTPTVMIACTAAHRDTGVFEAARYGIDRLKEIVPVWKKEVGPSGEAWVQGEYTPNPND